MGEAVEATCTIKGGAGHDASWFVAKGSPAEIKQQIIEFYGLTGDDLEEKTPHEVMLQGQDIAQATGAVSSKLNGTWTKSNDWPSKNDKPPAKKKSAPKKEEDDDPNGNVIAQIELAKTEDDLKKLVGLHRDAFKTDSVKAASKKRFQEIKEGK